MKRNLQDWRRYLESQIEEVGSKKQDNNLKKKDIIKKQQLPENVFKKELKKTDEILASAIKSVQEAKNPPIVFPDVDPAEILLQKDRKTDEDKNNSNYLLSKTKNVMDAPKQKTEVISPNKQIEEPDRQKIIEKIIPNLNNLNEEMLRKRNEMIKNILDPPLSISEVALLFFTDEDKIKELITHNVLSTVNIRGARKILLSEALLYLERHKTKNST